MPVIRFSLEECQQLRSEHEAGISIRQLAKGWDSSTFTVSSAIRRAGGKVRSRLEAISEPRALSPEEERQLVTDYLAGKSSVVLAPLYGVATQTVLNILERHEIERRPPGSATILTTALSEATLAGIRRGLSVSTVSRSVGVDQAMFFHWVQRGRLRQDEPYRSFAEQFSQAREEGATFLEVMPLRNGGTRRLRKGRMVSSSDFDESFFDVINTEEKAFLLGLMATDGCVTDKGRRVCISLQARDRSMLEMFNAAMQSNAPIRSRPGKDRLIRGNLARCGPQCCLEFRSRKLVDALVRQGIVEQKTFVVRPWGGPEYLLPHYWRGCLDGDGTISRNRRRRGGGYIWQIGLCGNRFMVDGFAKYVHSFTGSEARVYPHTSIWKIYFGGVHLPQAIAKRLYEGAAIALPRKAALAQEILATTTFRHSRIERLRT